VNFARIIPAAEFRTSIRVNLPRKTKAAISIKEIAASFFVFPVP
jgi:hypothetical protein